MGRLTKVRIIGDPELATKVSTAIMASFEYADLKTFDKTPARYAKSPGITIYLTVKRKRGT